MRSIGCGLVCLLFLVLSACNSDQSSREVQLIEDLHKVLKNVSKDKNLSKKLGNALPESGLLNEDHIAMYIWVKSRAMQMQIIRKNESAKNSGATIGGSETKIVDSGLILQPEKEANKTDLYLESGLTVDEIAALDELDFNSEVYKWVKQTIETTVEFVDASGDSQIIELVTIHDPVIKHNISLVNNFREKLQFASRVRLRLHNALQSRQGTQTSKSIENSNLIVELS